MRRIIRHQSRFRDFRDIAEHVHRHASSGGALTEKAIHKSLVEELVGKQQTVQDTYQACLNRIPENSSIAKNYPSSRAAADHIMSALNSDEFRLRGSEIIMRGYPEAPRNFFVHIPKTAGARVTRHLETHHFVWNVAADNPFLVQGPWP